VRAIWIAALAVPIVAAPAAAQDAPAIPLQPSGKWTVTYAESLCVIGRDFGEGDQLTTVALRPGVLNTTMSVVVAQSAKAGRPSSTVLKGAIEGDSGGPGIDLYFTSRLDDVTKRLISISADTSGDVMAMLAASKTATIKIGQRQFAIAVTVTPAVSSAFKACQNDLISRWGIDPAKLALVATQPVPNTSPGAWVRTSDYPKEALRQNKSGAVTIVYRVTPEGRVADCKPVWTSNVASIDEMTCRKFEERGRYAPGRDSSGQPIDSWQTARARWSVG